MNVQGKKIYVGLSGGVDSAVSAALLARAGAQVTGVFILGWYPPCMPCTWAEDRRDAMRIAAHLGIPFKTLDASAEYKASVIDYLLQEYRAGRTPNPDVMCNRDIKFGVFYRFAKANKADYIATGHYLKGEKDQRYFMWAVPKKVWEAAVFPVGHLDKTEVRKLARSFKLPVAEKKDSQGICFLGSVSVEDFLASEFNLAPGKAYDEQRNFEGVHRGAALYTLGERVPLTDGVGVGPWFVQAKDVGRNELTVTKKVTLRETHSEEIGFIEENIVTDRQRIDNAQMRYRGMRISGKVKGDRFIPQLSLTELPVPGQSIVFYAGEELVGGGIIT